MSDKVKKCARCHILKVLVEYAKHRAKRDGLSVYCKACEKQRRRDRRERLHADILVQERDYYAKNRAARLASAKRYRESHRKEIRARGIVHDHARYAERRQTYFQRPDVKARYAAHSSARRSRAGPPLSSSDLLFDGILRWDPCAYCGASMEHVDHIVPLAGGGEGGWENLTAACAFCNRSKGKKPMLVWLAER